MALWLFAGIWGSWFQTTAAVRPNLGSGFVFVNDDRAQCMRQDNLDIAGGDEANHRYILREVYSPSPANPQSDIYFLCEEFEITSINAELSIRRVQRNEFEFELNGALPHKTPGRSKNMGQANFVMKGFELVTGMKIADWAADFAANRDVLRKGQRGTMSFSLSGRVRATILKGVWEAELVRGSEKVDHFELTIHSQWVIDKVLRSWGKLKELIVNKLFELLKTAIPINLLASLHYLPFNPELPDEQQNFYIEANLILKGGTDANRTLNLQVPGYVRMYARPAALLDVLMRNFNVKEMARDAVISFFQDPETREAFKESRETFAENLHQYRFVVSEPLLKLVAEAEHLDELMPLLLNAAEERANDLLLKVLDPLVQAHAAGTSGIFKRLKVHFRGRGGWKTGVNNGLFEGYLRPSFSRKNQEAVVQMNRSLLGAFGLREHLLEPIANAESCVIEMNGFVFDINSLRLESGLVQNCRRSMDNKSAIAWEVRIAEFSNALLRLPAVFRRTFEASSAILGVELKPDGRVLFTAHKDGLTFIQKERSVKPPVPLKNRPEENSLLDGAVPVTFQRPAEVNPQGEKGFVDRFDGAEMTVHFDLWGTAEDTIGLEIGTFADTVIDVEMMLGDVLAPRSRQDFGYVFETNLFHHYSGRQLFSTLVMAVLHCGYFSWPLNEHGSDRLSSEYLLDIDLFSVMAEGSTSVDSKRQSDGSFCLEVRYKKQNSNSWFWGKEVAAIHHLCGTQNAVTRMATAISVQKVRFRDPRATYSEWNYGSHEAGKEGYLLKDGQVQRNLVEVMKDREEEHYLGTQKSVHAALKAAAATLEVNHSEEVVVPAASSVLSKDTAEDVRSHQTAVPITTGSSESQDCRAEELLNLHWPPEKFGDAVLRKAFPTKALGIVYVIIQQMQLVKFDLRGTLRRSDDTTFSLMLSGPDNGQAFVQMYLDGIDFSAPKSNVPGFVRHASVLDHVFRPMEHHARMGTERAGGLNRGPLWVKFKMLVEFQMKNGHWEVKPGALSDVEITFGNGGAVESMINTLLDIFGKVDELLLETLWPMVVNYFPEDVVQALEEVSKKDGQLAHHFKILAQCQKQIGDRCGSDRVDFFIKDLTNVDVAASTVLPMYLSNLSPSKDAIEESLALTLLNSYVNCTLEHAMAGKSGEGGPLQDMLGQAIVSLAMDDNTRAQVNVSTQAVAPVKMLRCFLGDRVLTGLLPKEPSKSQLKGAVNLRQKELNISKVQLQSFRLPFAVNGKEDAIELSATLSRAELVLNESKGMMETVVGHVDLELDAAKGLILRRITDGYPLLSMDVSPNFLESVFREVGAKWATPRNVRTGAHSLPTGRIDDKWKRPRAQPAQSLDFQQLLVKAHTSVGVRFSEREQKPQPGEEPQEHLQAQTSLILHATIDMNSFFWRAALNRKQRDYGFVFASVVGAWGLKAQGLPKQAAFLQISCDQMQIFELPGKGPFDQQVYSKDLHEMFIETGTPEFERAGDKICWKVQLNVNTWFQDPNYQFCGNVEEMISIQQALHLQLTRLASVLEAQTEAKVADEESTKTTGVRFTGEEEVFGDSTWFRRYNALDTSSWSPEIPVDYQKVETPLQRWHEAVRQVT